MEKSKPLSQSNGRDTFLSRVFGLQSEDVTTSIHTEEMSTFPEREEDDEVGSQLSRINQSSVDEETAEDEELRIPESDQGTTSDEEDLHTEDIDLNENSAVPKFSNSFYGADDSMHKVGQLSSDEEYGDGNESDSDDVEDVAEDDRPLFTRAKSSKSKGKLDDNIDHLPHSLLFRRILQHNKQKQQQQQLFTSSKDTHKKSYQNDRSRNQENNRTDLEAGNQDRLGNSFLPGRNPSGRNIFTSGFPLKRPNLFNNISVLNNTPANRVNTLSPKERALWKWANVENLDIFLQNVYKYYLGNGFFCIVLEKILNVSTLIFVLFISTYMGYCIDYSKLSSSQKLSDVMIDQCYANNITGITKVLLWAFYVFVVLKIAQLYFDVQNLNDIHNFYNYLLNISDKELQTIPWQNIIQQIMFLKDQNALTANVVEVKAKNRIDAHDVANRIMRKENYLIAMYNNDVLDLSLPLPLYRTSTLTKTLEWNINLCIMGYAFNESGFIKQNFLKPSQHEYIKEELKKRFMLAGFLNIILSPFLVTYFILLYFFRYFNEYKTSPRSLGARQYTPMAEWKFREYNELYHLFQKRIGLSAVMANRYIDQFPKEGTNIILRFVAFITGSFVAILAILTIFDPENFLNFEITNEKTALFYITILGAIWTVCRNSISDEYNVFDPEETILELATYTHYLPSEWEGRYHTEEVKNEFCKLYNLRVVILLRELASLILTPFILWFSLPRSVDRIVEFFRENSVYVDGLGYICKYAMFEINEVADPKKGKERKKSGSSNRSRRNKINLSNDASEETPDSNDTDDEDHDTAMNKMMQSYMYFIDDYENSDNAVGKHQMPHRRQDEPAKRAPILHNSYSWKKQFQPGQKPELFRIGKHSLETKHSRIALNKPKGASAQLGTKRGRYSPEAANKNLGESFISSLPLEPYDLPDKRGEGARNYGGGVLGMVKEFYNKSDIGR